MVILPTKNAQQRSNKVELKFRKFRRLVNEAPFYFRLLPFCVRMRRSCSETYRRENLDWFDHIALRPVV